MRGRRGREAEGAGGSGGGVRRGWPGPVGAVWLEAAALPAVSADRRGRGGERRHAFLQPGGADRGRGARLGAVRAGLCASAAGGPSSPRPAERWCREPPSSMAGSWE